MLFSELITEMSGLASKVLHFFSIGSHLFYVFKNFNSSIINSVVLLSDAQ